MLLKPTARAVFAFVLLVSSSSFALVLNNESIPYYGTDFYSKVRSGSRDTDLLANLRSVLTSKHQRSKNGFDEIVKHCDTAGVGCYEQTSLGYSAARKALLGKLHLVTENSEYGIKEVYCQKTYVADDFPSGPKPGPGITPDDKFVNVEHTWPQSRFNRKFGSDTQKCDLHHLFPTDSKLNSIRGNFKLGEVDGQKQALKCGRSKFGTINGGGHFFEPPDSHKGNAARALFYFSTRYQISIDPQEERFLRKWSKQDPVDAEEMKRNDEIQKIQGNRNPYIDFPELIDQVADF